MVARLCIPTSAATFARPSLVQTGLLTPGCFRLQRTRPRTLSLVVVVAADGLQPGDGFRGMCHTIRKGLAIMQLPNAAHALPNSANDVFARPIDAELAVAAARGRAAEIDRLVAGGADADAVGRKGITPLMWALVHDSPDGMAALLSAGADSTRLDQDGESAAHIAARAKDPALLHTLVDGGASLDIPDVRVGRTPLFEAIMADQQPQFEALVESGVDLDATDNLGNTPLHTAAKVKDYARALQLLQAGADPALRNGTGATFQRYLANGPNTALMSAEARAAKARITAWLSDHGIAIKGDGRR